ncbi:MAG: hypothetical protein ABW277_02750, partial [Longimicrobiaceae bacterium]
MRAIAVCALALLLGAAPEAGAQARAEAPQGGTVAVRATDGAVRVVGWSRGGGGATAPHRDGHRPGPGGRGRGAPAGRAPPPRAPGGG